MARAIEEHAKAIQDAINAAAADGFELDNGSGFPLCTVELNRVEGGDFIGSPVEITAPHTYDW
ncbi:hypothetical protein [Kitasatospora fiedleri]|uniref:hypothetical protein n=1 Tax=Kitasatospora fiedleri TaxID=2991545 RepID=UPI00249A8E4F|nr:hypothetical protein [Kitasatospora fiedleri]